MKPWLKNRNNKSAYNNIFPELLLNDKEEFRHYLRMNTTSYEVSNITNPYCTHDFYGVDLFQADSVRLSDLMILLLFSGNY